MSTLTPAKASRSASAATDVGEFITDLDGGVFDTQLSIALSQSAAAAVDNGKVSEVAIKLKLTPIKGSSMVHCAHTLTFTKPTSTGKTSEETTQTTALHVGKYGKLSLVPEDPLAITKKEKQIA